MWQKIFGHKGVILLIVAWATVVGALVVFGVRGNDGEPRYAGEDVLVSVSGEAVSEDSEQTPEPMPSPIVTTTANREIDYETGSESPHVTKPPREPDKPEETAAVTTKQPVRTERPRGTAHPRATLKPGADEATESPKVTPATYTFAIECTRILDRTELWRDGLGEVIPSDGYFYCGTREWRRGESVYDALAEICEENDILLDSRFTPLYNTYYVSGIGNLYEFDCGSESGWKYSVNGVLPGVGSSLCTIKKGDSVIFFYDFEI